MGGSQQKAANDIGIFVGNHAGSKRIAYNNRQIRVFGDRIPEVETANVDWLR
jgi:hypothetical protein